MGCNSSKTLAKDVHYELDALGSIFKEHDRLLPEFRRFFVPAFVLHPFSASTIGHVPELKKVISNNPSLLLFIKKYFKNNLDDLKILAELTRCLAKARDCEATIHEALPCFTAAEGEEEHLMVKMKYSTTISKLKELKTTSARDQFHGLLNKVFTGASNQHKEMAFGLHRRKIELDKKLSLVKIWRKVWSVACGAAFVVALICSVGFVAVGAPHVATATAGATSVAVKSVEQWFDLLWDGREKALGGELEVITKIYMDTSFAIHEINSIALLVKRVLNHTGSLSWEVVFTSRNEEAGLKVTIEEIKKKFRESKESIDNLEREVYFCTGEMGRALAEVLKLIAKEM